MFSCHTAWISLTGFCSLVFIAIWLWEIYLNSLSLSFVIYNMKPIIPTVLDFFYGVANGPKRSNLKQPHRLSHHSRGSGGSQAGSSVQGLMRMQSQCLSGLASHPSSRSSLSCQHGWWQNSAPCSCGTKDLGLYRLLPTHCPASGTLDEMEFSFFKANKEDRVLLIVASYFQTLIWGVPVIRPSLPRITFLSMNSKSMSLGLFVYLQNVFTLPYNDRLINDLIILTCSALKSREKVIHGVMGFMEPYHRTLPITPKLYDLWHFNMTKWDDAHEVCKTAPQQTG